MNKTNIAIAAYAFVSIATVLVAYDFSSRLIRVMTLVFLVTVVGADLMKEVMMTRTTFNTSLNTDTQACQLARR